MFLGVTSNCSSALFIGNNIGQQKLAVKHTPTQWFTWCHILWLIYRQNSRHSNQRRIPCSCALRIGTVNLSEYAWSRRFVAMLGKSLKSKQSSCNSPSDDVQGCFMEYNINLRIRVAPVNKRWYRTRQRGEAEIIVAPVEWLLLLFLFLLKTWWSA